MHSLCIRTCIFNCNTSVCRLIYTKIKTIKQWNIIDNSIVLAEHRVYFSIRPKQMTWFHEAAEAAGVLVISVECIKIINCIS